MSSSYQARLISRCVHASFQPHCLTQRSSRLLQRPSRTSQVTARSKPWMGGPRLFSSATVSSSSAGTGKTSFRAGKWASVSVLAAVGMAGGYYTFVLKPAAFEATQEDDDGPTPYEHYDYTHPFDSWAWHWRVYYRTKRLIFLAFVFLPCVTVAALVRVTESERLRAYLLELLVETLDVAGCSFQKFGQWLSMRPDMFPPDMVSALSTLRQDIPPHDIIHTRKMIKESFGYELDEIFEQFDEKPVASGTVAQVHKAMLRPEFAEKANIRNAKGELVRQIAVKVRHPAVLLETWMDVELIYNFINTTDILTVPFTKDDFLLQLQKQVDFTVEARNMVRFATNFRKEIKNGTLKFPIVSQSMLSNCVLLEEWAPGMSFSGILSNVGEGFTKLGEGFQKIGLGDNAREVEPKDGLRVDEKKKKALASTVFDMCIKMFLRDNLIHGDLHAGNVMYDNNGDCVTVLDAGLTNSLEPCVQSQFGEFLLALCTADAEGMVERLLDFHLEEVDLNRTAIKGKIQGSSAASKDPEERERAKKEFQKDVQEAVGHWVDPSGRATNPDGGPISLGDLIGEVLFSLQRHGIILRSDVASCLMTMSITEGLIRSLDPDFDLVAKALPYFALYSNWTTHLTLGVQM